MGKDNLRINPKILFPAAIVILIVLAIALRSVFIPFESGDFTYFLQHWYATLSSEGFSAFGERFADYNFPYLYLLYLVSLLAPSDIVAIKLVSVVFDIVLCYAVWLVMRHYKPGGYTPYVAALVVAFLPTVFLNSSAWGQCDALYTSLLIFSFYFIIKKRHLWSWLLWGIALSFKLQAVFFLPVLVYVWFITRKEQKWYTPAISFLPLVLAPIPAILAGRSPSSAYGVYLDQAGAYQQLTLNAANWFQWIPNAHYAFFNKAGFVLSVAVLGAVLVVLLAKHSRARLEKKFYLPLLASLFLLLAPFLLPQMHERYFFAAGIFLIMTSFLNPKYILPAIAVELISLFSYIPFLLGAQPPVSLGVLSLLQLAVIIYILWSLLHQTQKTEKGSLT